MKTLEQILEKEKANRHEDGIFGIKACKESIKELIKINREIFHEETSLFNLLEEFTERSKKDVFFNDAMVLACWELINGIE